MKIAVGSDEKTYLSQKVVEDLKKRGHQVELLGALVTDEAMWPQVAVDVAKRVAAGDCDQGVLFCWTGTGVAIAANKLKGIRAALCNDPETARGARKWNDANILAMSLRLVSEQIGREILDAWFSTDFSSDENDHACLSFLHKLETT